VINKVVDILTGALLLFGFMPLVLLGCNKFISQPPRKHTYESLIMYEQRKAVERRKRRPKLPKQKRRDDGTSFYIEC
jgi:hypothetical protein